MEGHPFRLCGIGRFTITVDPDALGYAVAAIMLLQIDADKHDVAKIALSKIPEISEVYSVLGEHDLFIKDRYPFNVCIKIHNRPQGWRMRLSALDR